jgi:hypothetical protein
LQNELLLEATDKEPFPAGGSLHRYLGRLYFSQINNLLPSNLKEVKWFKPQEMGNFNEWMS